MIARFDGTCKCGCGSNYGAGTEIIKTINKGWVVRAHATVPRPSRENTLLHGLRPMARLGQNPWVTEAVEGEVAHAFGEHGVYFSEYQYADQMPPITCAVCGAQAWFKPTVGAYVCTCGAVGRAVKGEH